MKTVWKYSIPYTRQTYGVFDIPENAFWLHTDLDPKSGEISLWYEVEPDEPRKRVNVLLVGTGQLIPEEFTRPRGTVVIAKYGLVLHLFEADAKEEKYRIVAPEPELF